MLAFGSKIELAWVAGIVLLNVKDRFVHQAEGDFCGDRLASVVTGGDLKRPFFARLVLGPIRLHIYREEVFQGRNDDLFCVYENLPIVHHGRAQENVRHMLFFNRQFDELNRTVEVNELVVI